MRKYDIDFTEATFRIKLQNQTGIWTQYKQTRQRSKENVVINLITVYEFELVGRYII